MAIEILKRGAEFKPEEVQNHQQTPFLQSPIGQAARSGIGLASDIGSNIVGTPGDILSLGLAIPNYLTGGVTPSYGQAQEKLPILPPTSGQIKGKISKLTGGFTEAQSENEGIGRNILETAFDLFVPSRLAPKLVSGFSRFLNPAAAKRATNVLLPFSGTPISRQLAAGKAIAGEVGQKGAEYLGFDEPTQLASRLAFMTLAGTAGTRKAIEEGMRNNYQQAEKALQSSIDTISGEKANLVHIPGLKNEIKNLKNEWEKSGSPYKPQALSAIKEFEDGLQESSLISKAGINASQKAKEALDYIPGRDALRLKRSLNEWIMLNEFPKFEGQPYLPKAVRRSMERSLSKIKEPLDKLAKENKDFGRDFFMAEDAFKGFSDLSDASRFLKEHVTFVNSLKSDLGKAGLLGLTYLGAGVPGVFGAVGAAKGIREAALFKELMKSEVAKKAYWESIKAAMSNSLSDFKKEAHKFDKIAQHYENKKS